MSDLYEIAAYLKRHNPALFEKWDAFNWSMSGKDILRPNTATILECGYSCDDNSNDLVYVIKLGPNTHLQIGKYEPGPELEPIQLVWRILPLNIELAHKFFQDYINRGVYQVKTQYYNHLRLKSAQLEKNIGKNTRKST